MSDQENNGAKKTRSGWTEERRQKTMATRAANKAAKKKEIDSLKAQVDILSLEIVEKEAVIQKQAEEIEELRKGHEMAEREPQEMIRRSRELSLAELVMATRENLEASLLEALNYLEMLHTDVQALRTMPTSFEAAIEDACVSPGDARNTLLSETGQLVDSQEGIARIYDLVDRAASLTVKEEEKVAKPSEENLLEKMTLFELNKKAADLGVSAGVNKDRQIEKIQAAMARQKDLH